MSQQIVRLSEHSIAGLARDSNLDADILRALLVVESNLRGFGRDGLPIKRFEPHIFNRNRAGWRDALGRSQSAVDAQFIAAVKVDRLAAYNATSWGMGQIMGFNAKLCGFNHAVDMVEAFTRSEVQQVLAVCRFLNARGLGPAVRSHDFHAIAVAYNGSGQPAVYAAKLRAAVERSTGRRARPVLSIGSMGDDVRAAQAALGVIVDGHFGNETRLAVERYQDAHGLAVDGVIGARTWAALISEGARPVTSDAVSVQAVSDAVRDNIGAVSGSVAAVQGVAMLAPPWALHLLWGFALVAVALFVWRLVKR